MAEEFEFVEIRESATDLAYRKYREDMMRLICGAKLPSEIDAAMSHTDAREQGSRG